MDLLFKRYASPFFLCEQMIEVKRFDEFVTEIIRIQNEETGNRDMWELYLHSSFISESFESFKRRCNTPAMPEPPIMEKDTLETTVQNTMQILSGFNPDVED